VILWGAANTVADDLYENKHGGGLAASVSYRCLLLLCPPADALAPTSTLTDDGLFNFDIADAARRQTGSGWTLIFPQRKYRVLAARRACASSGARLAIIVMPVLQWVKHFTVDSRWQHLATS
jgi:hypothetical protein